MKVQPDREKLQRFCAQHHIKRLAVFGSAIREDFGANSDIDVLVEFEDGRKPGLAFFAIQEELSTLFGRQVDLHTAGFLSPLFRDEILSQAQDLYVAA